MSKNIKQEEKITPVVFSNIIETVFDRLEILESEVVEVLARVQGLKKYILELRKYK